MPIDINAPDGTIARFPDGMSDDAITAVMRQHYPAPSNAAAPSDPYAAFSSLVAPAAPASGIVPAVTNTLRAINEGLPFSDRIVAGVKSLPLIGNNQSYADNLAQEQAARAQLNQAHPISTALGRGIGGVLATAAFPGATVAEAGLAPAMTAGMRTGAAYGAAQGVSDEPDLSNAGADVGGAVRGAVQGGSLGTLLAGLGYGAGRGISVLADRISNGQPLGNSGAANQLLDAYQADRARLETTPAGVNDSGDRIVGVAAPDYGPQGMVLDNGPAMLQLAKQTGATPQGAPIQTAAAYRANNFDRTVSDALPGIIGPDQSANAVALGIRADKASAGQALPAIFENAGPVDVTPVLATVNQLLSRTANGTPEAQALLRARTMLTSGSGEPVSDAATIQSAKSSLNNLINYGDQTIGVTPGALAAQNGALKTVAGGINDALRGQVPGYAGAMDTLSGLNKQMEALQYGRDLFKGGQSAVHPDDLKAALAGMSPAEVDAVQQGMNSEIYRQAGTQAKGTGLETLNKLLPSANQTGENWSGGKIGQVFDGDKVKALQDLLGQGNQFRTAADAIGNAAPGAPAGIDKRELANASIDAALAASGAHWGAFPAMYHSVKAFQPAFGSIGAGARNSALANALTSTGAAKDSIANAIGELLARRTAGQQMGSTLAPMVTGAGLGAFDR